MGKQTPKQSKKKPILIDICYQQVELGRTAINGLDRAFDILFDEVLKKRGLKGNPQNDIDNNRQLRT